MHNDNLLLDILYSSYSGPDGAPQAVTVTPESSTNLSVSWDPVPPLNKNGVITEYEIRYNQSTFSEEVSFVTVPADSSQLVLVGLEEYVNYTVSVRAYTSVGEGPFSSNITATTLEDGR